MKWLPILLFVPGFALADSFQYFGSKIDYWGDQPKSEDESLRSITDDGKFPWKAYMDPKNKEFFKEGDYTPPEPFMEVARNPSDENIKNWIDFIQKKNDLAARLQVKMQEYLAKNVKASQGVQPSLVAQTTIATSPRSRVTVEPSRFHFRMYFESTCPHCRRMFSVLKRLKDEGFAVEALQVDNGTVPNDEKIVPITKADPEEVKKRGVKGVPYLVVADLKRQALLPPVEGYHDYNEVLSLIKAAQTAKD